MYKEKKVWLPLLLAAAYFVFLYFSAGFRSLNFFFILSLLAAYYFHEGARRVVTGFLPFFAYTILYDSIRALPNYTFQEVNIQKIYDLEKQWFGIQEAGLVMTPNEYFKINTNYILDFLGGIFYGNWVSVPIILGIYLFLKNKRQMLEFLFAFLILNIFGIITYYLLPTAPPWYVELYGFEFQANTPGYEAGLENFDKMFGIHLFHNMYTKMNSQVFAAIPSLHSAFPILVLFYGFKTLKYSNLFFLLHGIGIWFFAVYLRHHYIIDVLLGIIYAALVCLLMSRLVKNEKVNRFLEAYERLISHFVLFQGSHDSTNSAKSRYIRKKADQEKPYT